MKECENTGCPFPKVPEEMPAHECQVFNRIRAHAETRPRAPHPGLRGPERKGIFSLEISENDWEILQAAFGDSVSAAAALEKILRKPPEIQILVAQCLAMIKKEMERHDRK